jgi:hypothetical protein
MLLAACISTSPTNVPTPKTFPSQSPEIPKDRLESIPAGTVKVLPESDNYTPVLHSDSYQIPVPLSTGVNSAGAEDSAFITPNGQILYFFFTPDPNIPAQKQLLDGVTGIYVSHKQGSEWSTAERVVLQDENQLALDGCVFVKGDEMWFGSARPGNLGELDIWTAYNEEGRWTAWQNAGRKLNVEYDIGEMHITANGTEMYFHSSAEGGKGGYDIWVTRKINGEWQAPENILAVNSPETDGWPFVSQDNRELWFTRYYRGTPAIFRSTRTTSGWGEPELIISKFAAEPSLDTAGNLYFTHHFFNNGKMLEADIYVAHPNN